MKTNIFPEKPVLLIDDEEHFLLSAELTISSHGIKNTETCSNSKDVLNLLKKKEFSLIVLDINMPDISGSELLPQIVKKYPHIPVIVLTAVNNVENAVQSMKDGAFDYVVKPVDDTRLVATIKRGLEFTEIRNENELLKQSLLKERLEHPEAFENIITRSGSMRAIFRYIEAIAKTNLPVLITGETGTGKELIANAIHNVSGRKGELVPVNVAGVDDNLFSDTLFGHKKGAFTGAEIDRKGLIEKAEDGTIFLDEIGDLNIESQVKLLRLLQDGQYYPLGSDIAKLSNARVVVATNKNIKSLQNSNQFRQDLYYRLRSHQIHLPSLRERKKDIPFLIDFFLIRASNELGKKKPRPPKELYTLLSNYHFPGNIRELQGIIYDAVSLHKSGILSLESIRQKLSDQLHPDDEYERINGENDDSPIAVTGRFPSLKESEDALINEALKRAEGNQAIAADLLGISRRALNNRLQRKKKQNKKKDFPSN